MSIGWFPGHMASARKKAAETLAKVDIVVEVIDARLPGASSNPMIDSLRRHRQRPCLKVLNKADLADPQATAAWMRSLEQGAAKGDKVRAVALTCRKPSDVARVPRLALELAPHRDSPLKPLRVMVMGIPNVGKSTLINALAKRKVANVGDEPAITKSQQRIDVTDQFVLFDTPGMLWPRIEHPSDGLMLAASHAIGVNAYIDEEVANFLGETLAVRYPALLSARYRFDPAGLDGPDLIDAIAKRRGFVLKGGIPDREKAAITLLNDYRSGALGRISLETPASRTAMLGEAARALATPQAGPEQDPDGTD
ncbi:MAG: ribosome biogenesis GTPase YlqF [Rhodocyclaceae bacterium]|nr:ribosome biogenesis GTPase YlqF [Rhodocyclaceae bacterium]MCA3075413.1 ribosome biogenesis GTPase YlqF [Rhodocyclaceae bacterium]MCA3091898.1 ribosome biogenesis GTPase YlqF [Rhodocyclaceae bacterium]MCA3093208.1 ribosome biogenesis GTPase YlqF [Rhodocyclaceae bacterium]MCA3097399.1 ribosome biogenesis GTPase YlqF [Rhodocyclaceae bacterium]